MHPRKIPSPRRARHAKYIRRRREGSQIHELRHRFANELAATLAALQLTKASGDRSALIDQAIDRVDNQGRLLRFLVDPLPSSCDIMEHVAQLCHLLLRSRRSDGLVEMKVSAITIMLPAEIAHAVLTIMNELLVNALKRVGRGVIDVHAEVQSGGLTFTVANECPEPPRGHEIHGIGLDAMRRIADEHGAALDFGVERGRFEARLLFPIRRDADPELDDDLPF